MSTPTSLVIPDGVEVTTISTPRGDFAAHRITPEHPQAHILLIPGWTGSKEDFTEFLPHLAQRGIAATAIDQRGQYESVAADDDDFSLAGFAADAVAVAEAIGERPTHLLGHSFGGLVAQTAAINHTDVWSSITLLCSGPGALGGSSGPGLEQMAQALDSMPLLELFRLQTASWEVVHPPEVTAFLEKRFSANSARSLKAMTQHLIDAPDVTDQLAATGLPVQVVRGADDDAWAHSLQDDMARRLGTKVIVLPDSAHSPNIESPAALADTIATFLLQDS